MSQNNKGGRPDEPSLDSRYGEIGILAVAAAVLFKSKAENPVDPPVVPQLNKSLGDEAA